MIFQNIEFLLILPLLLYPLIVAIKKKAYGKKIAATRTLTIFLLILAAASPAITHVEEATTDQKLNILIDNTTSMQAIEDPTIPIEGNEKVFVTDNNSKIFSQASQNIEKGSENLLITDGQTNQKTDELIREAEEMNASVSIYRLDEKEESSIKISGPSTTVPGAQNKFTVKITSTKKTSVPAKVKLDGEEIFKGEINKTYSFTRKFDSKGEHRVQASINSTDVFTENNQYYKTIDVQDKPKILTIGEAGSLEQKLDQFYTIETSQDIPENLDDYYTVIMKKPLQNPALETYMAEGNGLMYTGSMKEVVPDYLPVKRSENADEESGAKIVLVIDASFGTGKCENLETYNQPVCTEVSSEGGKAKESIRIAYSLVDSLKRNNEVGVIAYNRDSYLVTEPKSLAFNRENIKTKISRITPEGPSFHDQGLDAGTRLVERNDTIVMISDGKIGDYERKKNVPQNLRTTSSRMDSKLITVGMGEDPNKPLLEKIAENTGGYYLENNEAGRLKFRFGAGGGETEYTPIAVVNPTHFITRNVELRGATTGFSKVDTKRSAKTLVSGSNGNEVLSTWRYGLGRVAAFSAGQENLDRIAASDPEIISRTVSWTVGNPQRKQDNWINVKDTSRPSNPVAEASYPVDGLNKQSGDLYSAEITANRIGFNEWSNQTYAYNYNSEKEGVGQDMDKLQQIPQKTGGIIYSTDNIDQLPDRISEIDRKVERQVSLSPYLISLAILVFLGEIGYRKKNGRL